MLIKELFVSKVTRDIPPVVYFHEQNPEKVAEEVREYIITGGFPVGHVQHERVPDGIHEQYVNLLTAICEEMTRKGGPDLPSSWISGFYGSGKSSFAKLLGLALDGLALPDGRSLSETWLARDTSPRADELRKAWAKLREKVDPIAVVFDIGGVARDNEHIHSAVVRQIQRRLGYCATQPLVGEFELKLERDGKWDWFETNAAEILGKPWAEVKDHALAEEDFSLVLSKLDPEHYTDPMSWITSRAGTLTQSSSAEEATKAIADMLRFRAPGKTIFIVVDEVSQYIHQDEQRMLKLQSFVSELGQRLKGQAWLLVTGQQKLEEADETAVLGKLKGRFKPKLRVHLAATNIRDVVHQRLLKKTPEATALLRDRFQRHRNDLKLFAYECQNITEEDFVDVYPMLPGHIDLLLKITTALRVRSSRTQGDDQAIRGLLQLLGELFRSQKLAEEPVGRLVTLDQIYEVQHSALDSDLQSSMIGVLAYCQEKNLPLGARAAKAVALLELIQEEVPTDANLVARCLYDQLDRGSHEAEVKAALEQLRRDNKLGYSEKQGYKIQSTAGEEWERDRRDISVAPDEYIALVQEALRYLVSQPARPTLEGRSFPWMAYFSDGHRADDVVLLEARDPGNVTVDLRMLAAAERDRTIWVSRSDEGVSRNRIVWVAGDPADLVNEARQYGRSLAMVSRYKPRRDSLTRDRQRLLLEEEANAEDRERLLREAVDAAWIAGTIYFRGRVVEARELGTSFAVVLAAASSRFLPDLYPSFLPTQVSPTELLQLLDPTLHAPSSKFTNDLGILSVDGGKYVPSCHGVAPQRVMELIDQEQGVGGGVLLSEFGGPPYGYVGNVVRACVLGLLRGGKIRIQPESGQVITATRDADVREVFEKDRGFKRATFFPAKEGTIGARDVNMICQFFKQRLNLDLDRDQSAIADAVGEYFPRHAQRLRDLLARFNQLPVRRGSQAAVPGALGRLEKALESCVRVVRQTEPTVQAVKRTLDDLNDGFEQLSIYDSELTEEAIRKVQVATNVVTYQLSQLEEVGGQDGELESAASEIRAQLETEKPWRDLAAIDPQLQRAREAYVAERRRLLAGHGELAEAIRGRVKGRAGFSTLTGDQSHHVLRPIAEALINTSEEAVSPRLVELRDRVRHALATAEEEANARLDQILSEGKDPPIRRVELRLRNREISSHQELDAVLDEVRSRVEPELRAGRRVRLVD
jgi:hypothetical protein